MNFTRYYEDAVVEYDSSRKVWIVLLYYDFDNVVSPKVTRLIYELESVLGIKVECGNYSDGKRVWDKRKEMHCKGFKSVFTIVRWHNNKKFEVYSTYDYNEATKKLSEYRDIYKCTLAIEENFTLKF